MKTLARGVLIGVCALALSGVGTAALAQRGEWRDIRGDEPRMPRHEMMAEHLELSEAQAGQLKDLREQGRSQMADLRKEMMRVKNKIRGEMLDDNPDMDTLKKLTAKKGDIRTKMDLARLEHRMAMREILTEEQLDKLMMHRSRGKRGYSGAHGHGFGHERTGRGHGARRGGPRMGMELGDPGHDCLGLGDGPYLWCEE